MIGRLPNSASVVRGTKVVCENGHEICTAVRTIFIDDLNWSEKLGRWRQERPERGSTPVCAVCGGHFYRGVRLYLDGYGLDYEQMHADRNSPLRPATL